MYFQAEPEASSFRPPFAMPVQHHAGLARRAATEDTGGTTPAEELGRGER